MMLANDFLSVFADEAGCFGFHKKPGATRYFSIVTVTMRDFAINAELLNIRRNLIAAGEIDRDKLHATEDTQVTRNAVFDLIRQADIDIDCTLLEKSKAQPQTRPDDPTFYRYAWYYHGKFLAPRWLESKQKVLITAAALGSKKTKAAFKAGVNNALQASIPRHQWEVSFMPSSGDPGLWVADYCAWAILRKWERGDSASYDLIADKIRSEFDLWRRGDRQFY